MRTLRHLIVLAVAVAALGLGAASLVACSLNPQPLPPIDTPAGALDETTDAAAAFSGKGAAKDAGRHGEDAAADAGEDVVSPDAGGPVGDGSATDATDATDAAPGTEGGDT
jgi:hypothetical protein